MKKPILRIMSLPLFLILIVTIIVEVLIFFITISLSHKLLDWIFDSDSIETKPYGVKAWEKLLATLK